MPLLIRLYVRTAELYINVDSSTKRGSTMNTHLWISVLGTLDSECEYRRGLLSIIMPYFQSTSARIDIVISLLTVTSPEHCALWQFHTDLNSKFGDHLIIIECFLLVKNIILIVEQWRYIVNLNSWKKIISDGFINRCREWSI